MRHGFFVRSFGLAVAALLIGGLASLAQAGEGTRSHTYVDLGVALTAFPSRQQVQPVDPDAEPIHYRSALGARIRGSWQAAWGGFLFGEYLGAEGCVDDCLGGAERNDTTFGLDQYSVGAGWEFTELPGADLFATVAREWRRVEACEDEGDPESCRKERRDGVVLGLGGRYELGADPGQVLEARYERLTGMAEPSPRLLPQGDGRLILAYERAFIDGVLYGRLAYREARNRGLDLAVRIRF